MHRMLNSSMAGVPASLRTASHSCSVHGNHLLCCCEALPLAVLQQLAVTLSVGLLLAVSLATVLRAAVVILQAVSGAVLQAVAIRQAISRPWQVLRSPAGRGDLAIQLWRWQCLQQRLQQLWLGSPVAKSFRFQPSVIACHVYGFTAVLTAAMQHC